jgi:hypothetical protein
MNTTPSHAPAPFISTQRSMSRRQFLRAAGVGLSLPWLDAMCPAFARDVRTPPQRMLAICNNLGVLPGHFFPTLGQDGRGYRLSTYLDHLAAHREDFTVMSGVSHPDVDGGHPADICFLTAAPHPGGGGFRNTISLDQFAAERIGHLTRFPSLTLGVNTQRGQRSLSWTGGGVLIPCEEKPSDVFRHLFLQGTPEQIAAQERSLELGESVMDAVADQTRSLRRDVGARDRARLDQYFTGVRDLEKRLAAAREWEGRPKPRTSAQPPIDVADPREYLEKTGLMYDMARLAFESDSTRLVTLMLDSMNSPAIEVAGAPVSDGYHNLSHHGRSPAKLQQLEAIDREHMKRLAVLFTNLKNQPEEGGTLFDRTMVLYGSNLGDANMHVTTNLPVLLAGGGFKHGQHLAFDTARNYPLPNLFVSMLQRMGIEADKFASSTGTFKGLEPAGA